MRYRSDQRGTRDDVLLSNDVKDLIDTRAEQAADWVRAKARAAPFEESTGDYLASIEVRKATPAKDRWSAVVTATVPYAERVEQKHHIFAGVIDYVETL